MNDKLFQRVKAVYEQKDQLNLNQEQARLLEITYKDFIRSGAALNEADKNRLREINMELSKLALQFSDNVLKETNQYMLVIDKQEDLAGLPQSVIDAAAITAKNKGQEGKWVFTLHNPSRLPFLQYSERRELREALLKAYINRGDTMMPLVSILVVFGGFMFFDLEKASSWSAIFAIIGTVVTVVGILGFFIIKEPPVEKMADPYWESILYGFRPKTVKSNPALYLALLAFIIFNISIQIFMPYLIIYYEVSLQMTNYVLIMAPAIILASVVTALWGRVYDKKGFTYSGLIAVLGLMVGYVILFFTKTTVPVFIGSLFMMSGYLAGMAVFGAVIRDNTPVGKAGRLQGVRIFSQVLIPGVVGPAIGKKVLENAEVMVNNDGTTSFIPNENIFLAALIAIILVLPFFIKKKKA